ncbi:TetR/AcrR family transcriptional regulator [Dyadobacter sediminis]|uniref:TetR/AcrR family transcriptional regulator n=1 Tax=Dyadobacter sediminis TaxID=1493691 RepID=A0A5R9KJX0_9BACT|nr:TetR/AcrR family transcriptional regulator [Dyadobacter sediminis]TLU96366.1 TetR/AcrR family transcriptional regulator [Dyadobacter sediminis]
MKDTKAQIVESAIIVFNTDFSASLDMVAEKAGVHRRTLHIYFGSRQALIECCKTEMMTTCQHAMTMAYEASVDPVKQLELMLYAGIECGAKYAFLDKFTGILHMAVSHRMRKTAHTTPSSPNGSTWLLPFSKWAWSASSSQ